MPGNQFWVGENGRIESSELINLNSYEPTKNRRRAFNSQSKRKRQQEFVC